MHFSKLRGEVFNRKEPATLNPKTLNRESETLNPKP